MTLPIVKVKDSNIHKSNEHKILDKNVVCYLCDVRFTQKKALYVHLRNKHNIEPLEKKQGTVQCPECKNMFYDKYNLRRHCRRAHGASPVREEKRLFLRGRVVDTNRKPQFILNIERNYSEKFIKENKVDNAEGFTCDICQDTFTAKSNLIRHFSDVHMKNKNLKCIDCNEEFEDKRSLLNHTHPLEKYGCLQEILPDIQNYKYEVAQLVQINESSFVCEIFCNLKSRDDSNLWLDKFQRKNKVTFRKMRRQCQSFDESYVFIVDRYRCQHNTLPKRRSTPHAKHTGCSATLFIRVYQNKHFKELSWSRIRIKHTHNHLTDAAAKFRDPVEEVVNKFRSMFQAGKGPKAALNEHIKDLQLLYGDECIADRGICPTSRWVYNFYRKMTKQRFENDKKKPKSKSNVLKSNVHGSMPSTMLDDPEFNTSQKLLEPSSSIDFNRQHTEHALEPSKTLITKHYISTNVGPTIDKFQANTEFFGRSHNAYQKSGFESLQSPSEIFPDVITNSRNSCLVQDKLQKSQLELAKHTLHDFDNVMAQIRSRISMDPMYFLNAMKNFINTYNSTLRNATLLNSALYSFGKYSDFEIN